MVHNKRLMKQILALNWICSGIKAINKQYYAEIFFTSIHKEFKEIFEVQGHGSFQMKVKIINQ